MVCRFFVVMNAVVALPPGMAVQKADKAVQIGDTGTFIVEGGNHINAFTTAHFKKNSGGTADVISHPGLIPTGRSQFSQESHAGFLTQRFRSEYGSELLSSSQPWTASKTGLGRRPYVI